MTLSDDALTLGPAYIALGDGSALYGRLLVRDGVIAAIMPGDGPSHVELPVGTILAPGLIDLHTNGVADRLFNRDHGGAVAAVAQAYPSFGATAFLATVMTAPWESMLYAVSEIVEAANVLEEGGMPQGARCLGLHVEGPFLNPRGRGVHRPDLLLPATREHLDALLEASAGALLMATLAPEVAGACEAARLLREQGVVCSVGHTAARYPEGLDALEAGFRTVTHAFNAMPPLDHRDPSVLLAFLQHEQAMPQVICDGFHVAPAMIDLLARILGPRLILSTDAMPPVASGHHVRDGVVRTEDGTIAGSVLTPAQAVRNFMEFASLPFERAIIGATYAPARLLGLEREIGHLHVGARADLSLWDEHHRVIATFVGGRCVYIADGAHIGMLREMGVEPLSLQ